MNEAFEAACASIYADPTLVTTGDQTRALRRYLEECQAAGDEWATKVLAESTDAGLTAKHKLWAKRQVTVTVLTAMGKPIGVTRRVGLRRRSPATGDVERYWQQTLYEEMSWAEFEEHVANLVNMRDRLTEGVGVVRRVRQLRDRYPDTYGPAEAAARAGLSLEEVMQASA